MKTARVQLIENTTEKLSRILAENYGIEVIFKGDLCCTDGKRIFLPVIGEGAPEEFLQAIPGLVDHESSHVLHSDFTLGTKIKKHKTPKKLHTMVNICEDARIEAAMIKKWRGCRPNFEKTASWATKRLIGNWDRLSEWGKLSQMCGAVAGLGQDHEFTKWVRITEPKLWEYVEEVAPLLVTAKDQPDNKATLELAEQILTKLHELAEPPPEEEGNEGDESESDGDGDGKKKRRRRRKDNKKTEPGDSPAAPGDDDEDQDETDGDGSDEEEGDDLDEGNDTPESLKSDFDPTDQQQQQDDQLSDRQQLASEEARKTQQQSRGSYLVYTTERDEISPVHGGDIQAARKLFDESRAITNVMKMKMIDRKSVV